jgi:hypothetical protein
MGRFFLLITGVYFKLTRSQCGTFFGLTAGGAAAAAAARYAGAPTDDYFPPGF